MTAANAPGPSNSPTPPGTSSTSQAWQSQIAWHQSATDAAAVQIARTAVELRDEAERIARRAHAVTVSPKYVQQASEHLRIHGPSPAGDVLMGVGSVLLGLITGVGGTLLLTPVDVAAKVVVVITLLAILGGAAMAVGITFKLMKR